MTSIQVIPPDVKSVDPTLLAVAKFMLGDKELKQREAILNDKRYKMFKVKRAIRVLLSDAYKKKQAMANSKLPPIASEEQAFQILRMFPLSRLAFQVQKLETDEALKLNMKPKSGVPCLKISPAQQLEPEDYAVWFYEPVPVTTYLYALAGLASVFAIILFPLWPLFMRKGVWYLSMGVLGLIGAFFGMAIVRLIIYVITAVVLKPGLWIFPNLFEDLGVLDSFVPYYGWHGEDSMKVHKLKNKKKKSLKQKERKRLRLEQQAKEASNPTPAPAHGHGHPGGPDGQPNAAQAAAQAHLMQELQQINQKIDAERARREAAGKPMTPQESREFGQMLVNELTERLKASGGPSINIVQSDGPPPPSSQPVPQGPVKRVVSIEEVDE